MRTLARLAGPFRFSPLSFLAYCVDFNPAGPASGRDRLPFLMWDSCAVALRMRTDPYLPDYIAGGTGGGPAHAGRSLDAVLMRPHGHERHAAIATLGEMHAAGAMPLVKADAVDGISIRSDHHTLARSASLAQRMAIP